MILIFTTFVACPFTGTSSSETDNSSGLSISLQRKAEEVWGNSAMISYGRLHFGWKSWHYEHFTSTMDRIYIGRSAKSRSQQRQKNIVIIFVSPTASWRLFASLWGCCCSPPAAATPCVSNHCLCLILLVWRFLTDLLMVTLSICLPHSWSSADEHTWKLLLQILPTQDTIYGYI